MNKIIILSLLIASIYAIYANNKTNVIDKNNNQIKSIHDYHLTLANGDIIKLSDYKGKKILIVNTATECGFTNQLESLQSLQDKFNENLIVIGTPSNNFMNQEPRENNEIISFCKLNYGVEFIITEKIDVKGENIHPVYNFLTNKVLNGFNDKNVSWNFNKFLIDEDGFLIKHFGSMTKPLSNNIISLIK